MVLFQHANLPQTGTPGHVMLPSHTRHSLNASLLATHHFVRSLTITSQLRPSSRVSPTRLEAQTQVVLVNLNSTSIVPHSPVLGVAPSVMDHLFEPLRLHSTRIG